MESYRSTAEAADYLNVSVRTVERWCKASMLSPVYMGGRLKRFPQSQLDALVKTAPPIRPTFGGRAIAAE
jgi:excisionase family DNA binding protein